MNRQKSSKKLARVNRRHRKEFTRLMLEMIADLPLHSVRIEGDKLIYSYRSEDCLDIS